MISNKFMLFFQLQVTLYAISEERYTTESAVAPPPWADPKLNPCAVQPRGWQLLYWPPDGKCYKIFKMGYPCPDDMELSPPVPSTNVREFSAECRCPPKTAQSTFDGHCYELFKVGPCQRGQYFAPDDRNHTESASKKRHWGVCKDIPTCKNSNEIFWPPNGRCYQKLTRGPCTMGQLITSSSDGLAMCACNRKDEMYDYFYNGYGCFQHFTKGPCKEKGHLFLPDRNCDCNDELPHYHDLTEQCFEIGSIGPCQYGEEFQLDPSKKKGICSCKKGYIRYQGNSRCYRPYTQGPCSTGQMLMNETTCDVQSCKRGELYFPNEKTCYRVGRKGPCRRGQVVTFDFETRPSIDGISYNGLCRCVKSNKSSKPCEEEESEKDSCIRHDQVLFKNKCYKLYTQGPCMKGAWLTPVRHRKEDIWTEEVDRRTGTCDCMPGYTRTLRTVKEKVVVECLSPSVILADYLNKNYVSFNETEFK